MDKKEEQLRMQILSLADQYDLDLDWGKIDKAGLTELKKIKLLIKAVAKYF